MKSCVALLILCLPLISHAGISCHLHAPIDPNNKQTPLPIQGPYPDQEACSQENMALYQMKGYCHCGFANNAMPLLWSPKSQKYNLREMR